MSEKNLIGPTVCKLRTDKGWTQAQLAAKLAERGWQCSADHISKLERGEEAVSDAQFLLLGFVLEVDYAELFPPHLSRQIPREPS